MLEIAFTRIRRMREYLHKPAFRRGPTDVQKTSHPLRWRQCCPSAMLKTSKRNLLWWDIVHTILTWLMRHHWKSTLQFNFSKIWNCSAWENKFCWHANQHCCWQCKFACGIRWNLISYSQLRELWSHLKASLVVMFQTFTLPGNVTWTFTTYTLTMWVYRYDRLYGISCQQVFPTFEKCYSLLVRFAPRSFGDVFIDHSPLQTRGEESMRCHYQLTHRWCWADHWHFDLSLSGSWPLTVKNNHHQQLHSIWTSYYINTYFRWTATFSSM